MALAADADDAALRAYYAKRASEYESIYAKPERQADLALLSREVPELLAGQDEWRCAVRVADRHGKPIDLEKEKPAKDGSEGVGVSVKRASGVMKKTAP